MVTTTQEYVDHFSSEVPLEVDLDNLSNIFGFFFGFLSSILVLAIVIRKQSLLLGFVAKIISQVKNLFAACSFKRFSSRRLSPSAEESDVKQN